MSKDSKDIKVPIKDIIEQSIKKYNSEYEVYYVDLLRRYFISCLNLGFFELQELTLIVDKFTSRIRNIVNEYDYINKMDYYSINGTIIFICGELLYWSEEKFILNFYKAITEVIFDSNDEHIGFNNAICEMVAEKTYNMDVNSSRIIMPNTIEEIIADDKIQIRAGYSNYNLIISLLKQLFIARNCNENKLLGNMFSEGYNKVLMNFINDETNLLLLEILDKLCIMYINRLTLKKSSIYEKYLVDKYQLLVNKLFNKISDDYFAFCALITSDSLREQCMKLLEDM